MKLGDLDLKYVLSLAPMAGYTDRAMRVICRRHGCEYSVTEMVSAKAVVFGDKKTFSLAAVRDDEGPVILQIFGSEPDVMARGAGILLNAAHTGRCASPVAIDINMGCPVKKIFSNGEGSSLMRDPDLIYRIVKAVRENIDIPVTVKMRAGISKESRNAPVCAIAAEEAGASLITVHGRTRDEMYTGTADRLIIADVKKSVHIPVIANGDVRSGEDAVLMLRDTGADGIAVGRGAVGNPFIFREIKCALSKEPYAPPTQSERVETALEHIRLAVEDKGETIAVPEARKQIASYFSSFRGASKLRAEINRATTLSEVERILNGLYEFS
jgi:nifR3 family TIM-barrel protein